MLEVVSNEDAWPLQRNITWIIVDPPSFLPYHNPCTSLLCLQLRRHVVFYLIHFQPQDKHYLASIGKHMAGHIPNLYDFNRVKMLQDTMTGKVMASQFKPLRP